MDNIAAVVLAAGKGKRMKSDLPKVLHPILGRPLICHLLDTLISLNIKKIVVVIGHRADLVRKTLINYQGKIEFVLQEEQLGTGHAVMVTEPVLHDFQGDILVLLGDVPFLSTETIKGFVELHRKEKAAATVLSSTLDDATGYGRIVRAGDSDEVQKIVEHKDATEEERAIGEFNTGTFCFDNIYLFDALKSVKAENSQGEYYLTDLMEILRNSGKKAAVYCTPHVEETLGVNSVEQLAELEVKMADKIKS